MQGERGALALTLTLLALDLAVLFRVLLHFDVAITGGIARRAAAARREAGRYGARRREAELHDVWELAVCNRIARASAVAVDPSIVTSNP